MEKERIPISEAAKILGVSIITLRRWAKSGKLVPTFVTPGGHRLYSRSELQAQVTNLATGAEKWAANQKTDVYPPPEFYCQTSAQFKARLDSFTIALERLPDLKKQFRFSLITAIVGEIGNNSFDHNLGNWPDVPGIYFGYDLRKRQVVLADRGRGVFATLHVVKPSLKNDADALRVAFTEYLSGRRPERRGNGLKFVRSIIAKGRMNLRFQSGSAQLTIHGGSDNVTIEPVNVAIRGTVAFIEF